ncbi:MAG: hypothetical protein HQ472_07890 [Ignavibacteria bacterium]|nr:hypothetical protein [Ignavibacteria bacterium]
MKTLEDLVRNSAKEWVDKSTPTMVHTAEKVVQRIRLQRLIKFGSAGIGGLSVVAIMIWAGSNSAGTATSPITAPMMVRSVEPQVELVATENPVAQAPSFAKKSVAAVKVHAPAQVNNVIVHQPSQQLAPFTVKSDPVGFRTEYERILHRAELFAVNDPLVGVAEYQGLARFCKKHFQRDLTISALRSARVLAEQTGDESLKIKLDQDLRDLD